jgi:hypothetical protein
LLSSQAEENQPRINADARGHENLLNYALSLDSPRSRFPVFRIRAHSR